VDGAVEALGSVSILVNNAGIYRLHPPESSTGEQWEEAWTETLMVNLLGAAHVSFWSAKDMAKRGEGRIINISSRGAFRGEPEAPAYGASKAGMNAMSQSMAKALASRGILVFAIAPGWVETDMALPHVQGEEGDAVRRQSPLHRLATPEEIARVVLFLASVAPASMTGAIVDVNGASYLRT
jgi:3-oxoacyl-[acyl-carrier protein] reductase